MKNFVVELNNNLKVKHDATFADSKSIQDPKIVTKVGCKVNWNLDRVEFSVQFKPEIKAKFVPRAVKFGIIDTFDLQQESVELDIKMPIFVTRESNDFKVNIHASFFSHLIEVFSPHKKFFEIQFQYTVDSNIYKSIYSAVLPDIKQNEWDPRKVHLGNYSAHEIGGFDLLRLYNKKFALSDMRTRTEGEQIMKEDLDEYIKSTTKERFEEYDFLRMMQISFAIEDLHNIDVMKSYELNFQRILKCEGFSPRISQVKDQFNAIMCAEKCERLENIIYLIDMKDKKLPVDAVGFECVEIVDMFNYQQLQFEPEELEAIQIRGKIEYIFGSVLVFTIMKERKGSFGQMKKPNIESDRLYHVQFIPNRVVHRVVQRSLQAAVNDDMEDFLFDFQKENIKRISNKAISNFQWMNPSIESNAEQQHAIVNIVNCSSYPAPYFVFGPPGTGKTTTIIEAIAQVIKHKPNAKILVTAGSNSSCDDLALRLLKYVSLNKVLRLYSPVYATKPEKIHQDLEKISNFRKRRPCKCGRRTCPCEDSNDDPTYEEFCTARVIVCTLISCGRLISAGIESGHFDYIFIDEAACQSEPNIFVPITGLGLSRKGNFAQIVLSGDHCQLGPIVQNPMANKLGMGKSMMERVVETLPQYKAFNEKYIMQLVQNYRSHPAIIQFSNEQFYDGKLRCFADDEIINFALGWENLPNENFPILFHHTSQQSDEAVGLSLKNVKEAELVNIYIRNLLTQKFKGKKVSQKDIGVITPYNAQKALLSSWLRDLQKIEIGSVDAFQGKEKRIIILSTVRSKSKHLGFLTSYQRLNVALTRAQSLLIVIGNSESLQKSRIWNKFIEYCYRNNAIAGEPRFFTNFEYNDDDDVEECVQDAI